MANTILPFPQNQDEMLEYQRRKEAGEITFSGGNWQEVGQPAPPQVPPTVEGIQGGINDVQGLIDQGIDPPQQDEPPIGDDLGTFSIPKDTETPTPDTTDLDAFYAGEQERAKQEAERQAKIDEEERKQLEERKEEQQNWWDRMMGKETIEEKEASALEETGVDVSEHFKRLDADLAEMDSMRDSFKAKMAERDMALAGVEGVGMPQGWMNDRKIVITNKYNAELRLMAANMDSMAASMEAREGRYDKALQFADRAVDNYTKDLQIEWQRYNEFADENEDLLRDLGKEYEEFVQAERDAKYNQLVEQDRIKREVMELDRKSNGQTNININDTLQEANDKYTKWLSTQTSGDIWATGTPTSYKEWQLAGSPGTYQEWVKDKDEPFKKLDIMDVKRYVDLYPDAGIGSGDTIETAEWKIYLTYDLPTEIQKQKDNGKTKEEAENLWRIENEEDSIPAEVQDIIDNIYKKGWFEKTFGKKEPREEPEEIKTETTEKTLGEKMAEIGTNDPLAGFKSFFGIK